MKNRKDARIRAQLAMAILLHAGAIYWKNKIKYWIGAARLLAWRVMVWISINIRL